LVSPPLAESSFSSSRSCKAVKRVEIGIEQPSYPPAAFHHQRV